MVSQFFSQALARPIVIASTTLELISGPSNFRLVIENRPSLRRGQKFTRLVDIEGQGSCLFQGSNNSSYVENHNDVCFYKDNYSAWDSDRGTYLTDTDAVVDVDTDTEIDTDTDTLSAIPQPYLKPFDKLEFARVYHLAALRVPAVESKSIAHCLQGHLLNWPKINNVARVDGDDLDENAKRFLRTGKKHTEVDTDSILQAVYGTKKPSSGLIERDQAADKFRVQGSLQFPALEGISRSGQNVFQKKMKPKGNDAPKSHKKFYMVEVDTFQDDRQEFEISLERMGFGMKKWRGPSRLLLLDPQYARKSVTELPIAIRTLLNQQIAKAKERSTVRSNRKAVVPTNRRLNREIVPCKLTLFYDFWSLEEILEELLPREESRPFMMEVVGHIGILKLSKQSLPLKRVIAKVILDKKWPKVKTIINQFGVIEGTRQLEVLAGNHALVTTVVENGFSFQFNLATLYWDMELAKERERLLMSFSKTDVVCDVFAGAGALALPAAKKVWRVFANESNPDVIKYLAKNVSQHKLQGKIEVYGLDGPAFLRTLLAFSKPVRMTQVVLSCFLKGEACLDALIGTFNQHNWNADKPMPVIHLYGTSDALDPENDFLERITCRLGSRPERIGMYRVQLMDCGKWMLRATFQLPKGTAFPNSF